jgi:hypothetical protein
MEFLVLKYEFFGPKKYEKNHTFYPNDKSDDDLFYSLIFMQNSGDKTRRLP